MHGSRQAPAREGRRGGEGQRNEALHVAGSAPIELVAAPLDREGIGGPGLAIHRNDVCVAREDDAALGRGPDAREQVGLRPIGVGDALGGDAQIVEQALDVGDQLQVRAPRGGVERDQPAELVDGASREILRIDHASDPRSARSPAPWPERRRRNAASRR